MAKKQIRIKVYYTKSENKDPEIIELPTESAVSSVRNFKRVRKIEYLD